MFCCFFFFTNYKNTEIRLIEFVKGYTKHKITACWCSLILIYNFDADLIVVSTYLRLFLLQLK